MGKFFMQVCRDNGLKVQHQHLFDRLTLPEFLKGKVCCVADWLSRLKRICKVLKGSCLRFYSAVNRRTEIENSFVGFCWMITWYSETLGFKII